MLCDAAHNPTKVYAQETLEELYRIANLDKTFYNKDAVLANPGAFQDVEYVFSTWGMPVFTEEEIKAVFPNLKYVFYGAGSVQQFARPFLNCGVKVCSAWAANGVPVAEYTVAQIILANKGFYQNTLRMSRGDVAGARKVA